MSRGSWSVGHNPLLPTSCHPAKCDRTCKVQRPGLKYAKGAKASLLNTARRTHDKCKELESAVKLLKIRFCQTYRFRKADRCSGCTRALGDAGSHLDLVLRSRGDGQFVLSLATRGTRNKNSNASKTPRLSGRAVS